MYPESSGGLLSTISQAALSDDESPPATHVPSPPKFNTASLARTTSKIPSIQPNYENVDTGKQNLQPKKMNPPKESKIGIPRLESPIGSLNPALRPSTAGQLVMTQGQFRAAASQAKVSTIPEDPGAYMPMGVRKGVMVDTNKGAISSPLGTRARSFPSSSSAPLATSSPSHIPTYPHALPTYPHTLNGNK